MVSAVTVGFHATVVAVSGLGRASETHKVHCPADKGEVSGGMEKAFLGRFVTRLSFNFGNKIGGRTPFIGLLVIVNISRPIKNRVLTGGFRILRISTFPSIYSWSRPSSTPR